MLVKQATTRECRQLFDERVRWREHRRQPRRHRRRRSPIWVNKVQKLVIPIGVPVFRDATGTGPATTMVLSGFGAITGNVLAMTAWLESTPATLTFTGVVDNQGNAWTMWPTARESTFGGYTAVFTAVNTTDPTTITVSATGTMVAVTSISFWIWDLTSTDPFPSIIGVAASNIPTATIIDQVPISPPDAGICLESMANDSGSATIGAPWVNTGKSIITYILNSGSGTFTPEWTLGSSKTSCIVGVAITPKNAGTFDEDAWGVPTFSNASDQNVTVW